MPRPVVTDSILLGSYDRNVRGDLPKERKYGSISTSVGRRKKIWRKPNMAYARTEISASIFFFSSAASCFSFFHYIYLHLASALCSIALSDIFPSVFFDLYRFLGDLFILLFFILFSLFSLQCAQTLMFNFADLPKGCFYF